MEVSTLIGILLIILKLTGSITVSWWIVTLPITLPALFTFIVLVSLCSKR